MPKFFVILFHVFREQWKNRFFQLVLIFAGVMLYAALLLGAVSVGQEYRALADFGFGLIELVGFAAVIFGCATTILKDMESKTIYLVLSRPVSRHAYLLGRLFGLFFSVGASIACMGVLHAVLLYAKGFPLPPLYFKILFMIWLKTIIIGSLAMTVSLFSTSILSSLLISSIFWTLGHFLSEARFLVEKSRTAGALLISPLLYIIPNLQLYNFKDRLGITAPDANPALAVVLGYTLLYCAACSFFSVWLFRKKEF